VDSVIAVTVSTLPAPPHARRRADGAPRRTTATLRLRATIVPTPPRARRVAWDTWHSLQYPPAYVPRDDLHVDDDLLDWHGDHVWTNFYLAHRALRKAGYFVEIVGRPWEPSTLPADHFGTLLLVDPERAIHPREQRHLRSQVARGLSVVVFADWDSAQMRDKIRFFDENTRAGWTPVSGGANLGTLNELLRPWNISFDASCVLAGSYELAGAPSLRARFASGARIVSFPARGGRVAYARGVAPQDLVSKTMPPAAARAHMELVPLLGFFDTAAATTATSSAAAAAGEGSVPGTRPADAAAAAAAGGGGSGGSGHVFGDVSKHGGR